MPPIREDYDLGPYRTIQRLPALHKDGLVESWLSQLPDKQERVVLNILRVPYDDLDEEHQRAYAALQNEVEILKKSRHLNIVRIYPLHPRAISLRGECYLSQVNFRDEAWWFWAMEYLEGGSLADRMEQMGRLPLEEAAEIIYQIGTALDYIHSKGIVHLNVHPRTIFFRYPLSGPDLRVELVLTDFANAARADQEVIGERAAEGELKSYVAPERIRPDKAKSDRPLDNRPKDVYSLGVLFYHMLAGVPPFIGNDEDVERAILGAAPPPLQRFDVPVGVEDLILQALQKDPAERPSIEHLLINLDKNVPPPRVVGVRMVAPGGEHGAPAEGTRPHTVPYTATGASRPLGAPGGVEGVAPPAPAFSDRLKARWQALTGALGSIFRRTPSYPVPKLLEPAEEAVLKGRVTFAWDWEGELRDNEAFELRVWKEGGPHDRAGELQREPELEIDLDILVPELPGEGDKCFWSVAVVRQNPYRSLSKEAKSRSFIYGEPAEPEETEETTEGD
ncbi:MAG: hypothetical protein DRI79_00860 [Chloroflexi bacterium]|nr:MAG: hypothetical protein DRI80_04520 [Chloroflexota bacterium]RLC92315.1 MAG: hypothetical protein DRI79_00860 [Chloroflexota bacterium]